MGSGVLAPLPRIGSRYTPSRDPYFSNFKGKKIERHGLKTDEKGNFTF
jgi:hypothetical protein